MKKTKLKGLATGEKGFTMVLAVILLLVGGLIVSSLLAYMGNGLLGGKTYEKRTAELYAADAGVEDAIWKIHHGEVSLCAARPSQPPYYLYDLNGKTVEVVIEYVNNVTGSITYRVISTAATEGGTYTMVQADVDTKVFDLLAGALVSMSDITFKSDTHPCTVMGDVYYVGQINGDYDQVEGEERQVPLTVFPTEDQIEGFANQFKDEALGGDTYEGLKISKDTHFSKPVYVNGNLYIENDVTIELAGTIYVEGSITAKKDYTVAGSGSIVAVGDIQLSKLPNYGIEGDTVIMSITGDITFKKDATINAFVFAPNGDFAIDKNITVLGGLVGKSIEVKKDGSFTYVSKASSYGFPIWVPYGADILTYDVTQH